MKTSYLFASLAALLVVSSCSKKKEEKVEIIKPVKMMIVGGSSADSRITYPATVAANRHTDLSFQVGGIVIKVLVKPGDRVKENQLLAKIDPRDYESNLKIAEAKLTETKADYERFAKLVKSGAVARADFEKRVKNYEVAKSDYQIAKKAFEDTRLKAPYDGVIAKKYIEQNQNVKAKQKILTIQNDNKVDISVNIPEQDIARSRRVGSRAKTEKLLDPQVTFPVAPSKHYKLTIKEFREKADPITQTFKVTFTMPSPKDLIVRPEMTATVSFKRSFFTPESNKDFKVPFSAVFVNDQGKKCIWKVKKDMTVTSVKVTTANVSGNDVYIKTGIHRGEKIIISGVNSLSEGMKVREIKNIGI